jgi:PAS domain S-box-containing protein
MPGDKCREQKATENHFKAVQKAAGPFVTAADQTRMPMLFSDPQRPGNPIIYANDSFLALTGYDREEVLGRSYHFLMGSETDPAARAQIEAAFHGGFHSTYPEVRYYRKDGSAFWAIMFIGPVLDESGEVVQHFASFIDITRRKQEENRLHFLLDELNHRTQNTLATVHAIAVQTLRGPNSFSS